MKKLMTLICALGMLMTATAQKSIYDFTVKTADGKTIAEMESIYEKYKDDGFVILDFPCNQFGAQAPGSIEEIHSFCTSHYDIMFPQFDKVDVNGENADPLFVWLKKQKGFEGFDLSNPIGKHLHEAFLKQDKHYAKSSDIKWNFTKFLVDKEGNVVERFEPTASMDKVSDAIYRLMY